MNQIIKLGTRGSLLALKQVEMVRMALLSAMPDLTVETVVIRTSGDWRPEEGEARLIEEQGGKGQFAKEIEEALLAGEIDAGVHSMKDMETPLTPGLIISCMLEREDARDVLLVRDRNIKTLKDLPEGATIGTASVRRQAFLLAQRSDLKVVPLRGNVETRIRKLRAAQVDATFLALAGLKRLGLEHEAGIILAPEKMLPAAGQGAIGIEIREGNEKLSEILKRINCEMTLLSVTAERAALEVLGGSCHTPIAAHAVFKNEEIDLRVMVAALDGSQSFSEQKTKKIETLEEAVVLGSETGRKLKDRIPANLLRQKIEDRL